MSTAKVIHVSNALVPETGALVFDVPEGTSIKGLVPKSSMPVVCRYCPPAATGLPAMFLLREQWECGVEPGSVTEFYTGYLHGGGDNGSSFTQVLVLAAVIAISVWNPTSSVYLNAALRIGATLAVNYIAAQFTSKPVADTGSAGLARQDNYNFAIGANQARIDSPIPVIYGRCPIYPDFAAEPYLRYDNDTGDQFYYAVFCVGMGEYEIEEVTIDDTPLTSYDDVIRSAMLPPGTNTLLSVERNCVTSQEVTGQELKDGRYVGGFVVCPPGTGLLRIEIDIMLPSLGVADMSTGNLSPLTLTFIVQVRDIDDFNVPTSPWREVSTIAITGATKEEIRKTYDVSGFGAAGIGGRRVEIRVGRKFPAVNGASNYLDRLYWTGLRGFLLKSAPFNPKATHYEVVMRASEQLNSTTQRKFRMIVRRKLQIWNGTSWGAPQATRNPAWALADKWMNQDYGDSTDESLIDLATVLHYAQLWDTRQDRFDFVFDTTQDSVTADQLIANAGRAIALTRNGVKTIVRDEYSLPSAGFSSRNIREGTASLQYNLSDEDTPDGLVIEYFDNITWDWKELYCPVSVTAPPAEVLAYSDFQKPQRVRLYGITGKTHAKREGLFRAALALYRRKMVNFGTEHEGQLLALGSTVMFSPTLKGRGKAGNVMELLLPDDLVNGPVVRLSEPVVYTDATGLTITFTKADGTLSTAVSFSQYGTDTQNIRLPAGFDEVSLDDLASGQRENPRYVIQSSVDVAEVVRINSIQFTQHDITQPIEVNLSGFVDSPIPHQMDQHLLPAPGEVQDPTTSPNAPVPGGDDGGQGAYVPIPRLELDYIIDASQLFISLAGVSSEDAQKIEYYADVSFNTDGTTDVETYRIDNRPATPVRTNGETFTITDQWMMHTPIEAGDADDYDMTAITGSFATSGGTAYGWFPRSRIWYGRNPADSNKWQNMNAPFVLQAMLKAGGETEFVELFVREAASQSIQVKGKFKLFVSVLAPNDGPSGGDS